MCSSGEEIVLSVDRFDPGVPTHSMDIGPTAVLDGDIPVRTRYSLYSVVEPCNLVQYIGGIV